MEKGVFEQPVLPQLESYRPLVRDELFRRAMIATNIRESIAKTREEHASSKEVQHTELFDEYVIAHRNEGILLGAIASRGEMDEYIEEQSNRRLALEHEEELWVS